MAQGSKTKIFLVVSLSVNLLIFGIGAGMWFTGGKARGGGPQVDAPVASQFLQVTRGFTRAERREFGRALRGAFQAAGLDRQAHRQLMQEAAALLSAEELDQDALASLLAASRQHAASRLEIGQNILMEYLIDMPVDARVKLADQLTKDRPGRR